LLLSRLYLLPQTAAEFSKAVSCLERSRLDDERTQHWPLVHVLPGADPSKHRADSPEARPAPVLLVRIDSFAQVTGRHDCRERTAGIDISGALDEELTNPLFDGTERASTICLTHGISSSCVWEDRGLPRSRSPGGRSIAPCGTRTLELVADQGRG